FQAWSIAGAVLAGTGGPIWLLGLLFTVCGALIQYLAWTVGLGGVLLHKLAPMPAAAAPPLPPPDAPRRPPFEPLLFADPHAEEDEKYAAAAGRNRGGDGPDPAAG
ncbi:MAG: hypothetical protein D6696_09000, partial [Acidobacteria bacterium]